MSYTKIVGTTYESFAIYVTDTTIMIYPLNAEPVNTPAFKINERTLGLLENAVKIVRERLTAAE
jgi:hypothetical protein